MLSKKKQVKHGGCVPPNLKRALQLAMEMDDKPFKEWFGNGCNQVCNRTVPQVAIKMLSCQQKHDTYLEITGYDLLFNHFFNEDGATFSTIFSEDEINGEVNKWTFTGSCSLNKDRFFDTISQNNHNDCPVKLFYNEPKYTADGTLEVLMMDSDFLLHVCDALIDEDEDAYVAFTKEKDVNAYFQKVHVVRAIDNILKKKGKHFLFPVTNKKNKKLLKRCIEEKLEIVEKSSSDEESSSDEDEEEQEEEEEDVIVVADDTELYSGFNFLQFMRDKLPATTDTDKKTTGISAVKFADAMVIPIASTAPWNRCKISNIFVPSVNKDGYYVLSGKRWKKAALTSKYNHVSNHGSSKSPTKGDAEEMPVLKTKEEQDVKQDDAKEEQTIPNTKDGDVIERTIGEEVGQTTTTTTTTTVISNHQGSSSSKSPFKDEPIDSEKEEQIKDGDVIEKSIDKNQHEEVGQTTTVMSNIVTDTSINSVVVVDTMCLESDLYAVGAFDDNEGNMVFTNRQVEEAEEMYRKREAKKVEEEEKARKAAAEAAAEAAKKVEEEEARKAASKKRKLVAPLKGRKRKKKTWTMPETLEEIPLWKKKNKRKDLIAKKLLPDGSYTYWIKEDRQWKEYTNDNNYVQSYLDMW